MSIREPKTYRGCFLMPVSGSSAGIRWSALCLGRTLCADTLAGLKSLIRAEFYGCKRRK